MKSEIINLLLTPAKNFRFSFHLQRDVSSSIPAALGRSPIIQVYQPISHFFSDDVSVKGNTKAISVSHNTYHVLKSICFTWSKKLCTKRTTDCKRWQLFLKRNLDSAWSKIPFSFHCFPSHACLITASREIDTQ